MWALARVNWAKNYKLMYVMTYLLAQFGNFGVIYSGKAPSFCVLWAQGIMGLIYIRNHWNYELCYDVDFRGLTSFLNTFYITILSINIQLTDFYSRYFPCLLTSVKLILYLNTLLKASNFQIYCQIFVCKMQLILKCKIHIYKVW